MMSELVSVSLQLLHQTLTFKNMNGADLSLHFVSKALGVPRCISDL